MFHLFQLKRDTFRLLMLPTLASEALQFKINRCSDYRENFSHFIQSLLSVAVKTGKNRL